MIQADSSEVSVVSERNPAQTSKSKKKKSHGRDHISEKFRGDEPQEQFNSETQAISFCLSSSFRFLFASLCVRTTNSHCKWLLPLS